MQEPQGVEQTEKSKRAAMRSILEKWGTAKKYIEDKQDEINDFRMLIGLLDKEPDESRNSASLMSWEGMPHSGQISNPTENIALGVQGLRTAYKRQLKLLEEDIDNRLKIKRAVDMGLEGLRTEYTKVLCAYYQDRECRPPTWDSVGERLGYSEDWVRQLERQAVDCLIKLAIFNI